MLNKQQQATTRTTLTSMPSLVDLLELKQIEMPNICNELLNISTTHQFPPSSFGLLTSNDLPQGRLHNNLDSVAFNGTPLPPKQGCFLEEPSSNQIECDPSLGSIDRSKKASGTGCKCKKTGCLKMYCECFYSGKMCTEQCGCYHCCNQPDKIEDILRARKQAKNRHTFAFEPVQSVGRKPCNCRKSQCQKKYCQCYNAGLPCNQMCKCEDCLNGNHPHSHKPQYSE